MNELIRATAQQSGVALADAEAAFATQSENGLPGEEFFYEHVHLTWEGNWLLARTLADSISPHLPASVTNAANARNVWPSAMECARHLGWTDYAQYAAWESILGRMHDPPFTHQMDHAERLARVKHRLQQLAVARTSAGIASARAAVETAVALAPDDDLLWTQLAELRRFTGDLDGAIAAGRRVTELLPQASSAWMHLGVILLQAQRERKAEVAFNAALARDPENVWIHHHLARLHLRAGQTNGAAREFRRALALKSYFGPAHLGLGQILEQRGDADAAQEHYQAALRNRIYLPEELTALGRFCVAKGWHAAAVTNLQDALKLSPDNPVIHRELAAALKGLDREVEAEAHLTAAARHDPAQVQARFLRGLELGRGGKAAEAAAEFREVVRLMPDLVEGRLNLAVALEQQGLLAEAIAEFQAVLRLSPTNQMAAEHLATLRARLSPDTPPALEKH